MFGNTSKNNAWSTVWGSLVVIQVLHVTKIARCDIGEPWKRKIENIFLNLLYGFWFSVFRAFLYVMVLLSLSSYQALDPIIVILSDKPSVLRSFQIVLSKFLKVSSSFEVFITSKLLTCCYIYKPLIGANYNLVSIFMILTQCWSPLSLIRLSTLIYAIIIYWLICFLTAQRSSP